MATQDPNVSPEAGLLNDRITTLNQNGHGWMDPTLQVGLAQNGGSNASMLNTAQTYANVLNNTPNTISNKYTDPSLNVKPGPVTNAVATVTNTHGPIPVKPEDVTQIQKNLQSLGFGVGLPTSTWNPAWQSAWQQHNYAQLTKPGVGNTDSFNLFKDPIKPLCITEFSLIT